MDHSANFFRDFGRGAPHPRPRSVRCCCVVGRRALARRGAARRRGARRIARPSRSALRSASRRSRARASAVAERAAARSASRDGLLPRRSACGVRRAALPALNFPLPWAASPVTAAPLPVAASLCRCLCLQAAGSSRHAPSSPWAPASSSGATSLIACLEAPPPAHRVPACLQMRRRRARLQPRGAIPLFVAARRDRRLSAAGEFRCPPATLASRCSTGAPLACFTGCLCRLARCLARRGALSRYAAASAAPPSAIEPQLRPAASARARAVDLHAAACVRRACRRRRLQGLVGLSARSAVEERGAIPRAPFHRRLRLRPPAKVCESVCGARESDRRVLRRVRSRRRFSSTSSRSWLSSLVVHPCLVTFP
jgi:hypothetical protein